MLTGSILSNAGALDTLNALAKTQGSAQTQETRLSSGKKISTPADNPAGFIEAQGFTSQANGLSQALQNANEGVSLIQTAQGGVDQQLQILDKLQSIATEASNGTEAPSQRHALQGVVTRLLGQINTISSQTQFNGQKLLNGTFRGVPFQVGAERRQTINLSIGNTATSGLAKVSGSAGLYQSTASVGHPFNGHDYTSVFGLEQTSGTQYSLSMPANVVTTNIKGYKGSGSATGLTAAFASASASAVNAVSTKTGVTAHGHMVVNLSLHGTGSATYKIGSGGGSQSFTLAHNSAAQFAAQFNALAAGSGKIKAKATSAGGVQITESSGSKYVTVAAVGTSTTYVSTTYKQYVNAFNLTTFTNEPTPVTLTNKNGNMGITFSPGIVLQSTHPFTLSQGSAFGIKDHSVQISAGGAGSSLADISVLSQKKAEKAIGTIQTARKQLTRLASYLGAKEQRFRAVTGNLSTSRINTKTGLATIEAANIPKVVSKLTMDQVRTQAGIAALKRSAFMQKRFLHLVPGG